MRHAGNSLRQKCHSMPNITICSTVSAHHCNSEAHGARSVQSTRTRRSSSTHFEHPLCKCGAQRAALTNLMFMNYTTYALHTVSALNGALCRCGEHCKWTQWCIKHVKCTLHWKPLLRGAGTVYIVSALTVALCKWSVKCRYTFQ